MSDFLDSHIMIIPVTVPPTRKKTTMPRPAAQPLTHRPLGEIAEEIINDWDKVNFAARPYLAAMTTLTSIEDSYGLDSAREIVVRFVINAGSWRGETAKRVKAELRKMAGMK